jgi:3-ketosteroid 9alpha-monooxygenase subunit B
MDETVNNNTPVNKKKIRYRKGRVIETILEAPETWTLHIEIPEEERQYLAGQFISIDPHQFSEISEVIAYLEHVKKRKELVRAYSLASIPSEPYISITIKPERFYPEEMEYPPLLSPLLASNVLKDRELQFLGYAGAYVLPADHASATSEVFHFVAGSGAVPNFALLKDELTLQKNTSVFHTLIDVNKTYADIIYREQLDTLQKQYASRFKIMHFLTREENPERHGSNYFSGRPTIEDLRPLIKDPAKALAYACGAAITKWQKKAAKEIGTEPKPRFLESMTQVIHELGIDKKRFKKEVYG